MAPQTVLITGCSSGMGMATAVFLAKQKQHQFKVYATMRNLKSKVALEKAAGDTLDKTLFIRELDVTKETTISKVVNEILRDNGRIDVLLNNAGYASQEGIDDKPLEWCQAMMDTNYWGVVRTIRAVLPAMKKQKSGRILNVSSLYGFIGNPFTAIYASTKFAVEGFSESIAAVLRDGYNIRVSIVEPGPVLTPLMSAADNPDKITADFDDIMKDLYTSHTKGLMTKMAQWMQKPEEIAQLYLEIILSDNPHLRYQTSKFVNKIAASKLVDTTSDGLLEALKK